MHTTLPFGALMSLARAIQKSVFIELIPPCFGPQAVARKAMVKSPPSFGDLALILVDVRSPEVCEKTSGLNPLGGDLSFLGSL